MTDAELVAKKLARIETLLVELRTLGRPERIGTDVKEERFLAHTLQLATQSVLDIASHIVSDERLGEPESYRDLFDRLARGGWIAADLAQRLGRMAGFRNLLVHDYAALDLEILREVVVHRISDLEAFAGAIRARI